MISDAKKAELDAVADERAGVLGQAHVVDGKQPYHGDLVHEHVAGNAESAIPEAIAAETEQSNG